MNCQEYLRYHYHCPRRLTYWDQRFVEFFHISFRQFRRLGSHQLIPVKGRHGYILLSLHYTRINKKFKVQIHKNISFFYCSTGIIKYIVMLTCGKKLLKIQLISQKIYIVCHSVFQAIHFCADSTGHKLNSWKRVAINNASMYPKEWLFQVN